MNVCVELKSGAKLWFHHLFHFNVLLGTTVGRIVVVLLFAKL